MKEVSSMNVSILDTPFPASLSCEYSHDRDAGDARHRRLGDELVCSVERECGFVKIHSHLRAKNSVKSPYFSGMSLAPAVA